MVLTGGTSLLPNLRNLAARVLGVPVRVAKPEKLIGMADRLNSPAFSTSVGLLRWAYLMNEFMPQSVKKHPRYSDTETVVNWEMVKNWLRRLLP
jgi:cell division protein FtsA